FQPLPRCIWRVSYLKARGTPEIDPFSGHLLTLCQCLDILGAAGSVCNIGDKYPRAIVQSNHVAGIQIRLGSTANDLKICSGMKYLAGDIWPSQTSTGNRDDTALSSMRVSDFNWLGNLNMQCAKIL